MSDDQDRWDPDAYPALMREQVPDYERLQEEALAAVGATATRVLELGTGTGETALRLLARHPRALLVGLDSSRAMLARARERLPADRVQLQLADLQDPLPDGPFDVVVSALAVHHLDGVAKADLFRRVAARLAPDGRFVLADIIVPADGDDVVAPIEDDYDKPSSIFDQLSWLAAAGLDASVSWAHRDLAVLVGRAPSNA